MCWPALSFDEPAIERAHKHLWLESPQPRHIKQLFPPHCSGLLRLRIEAIAGRLCGELPAGLGRLRRLRSLQLPDCGATQARCTPASSPAGFSICFMLSSRRSGCVDQHISVPQLTSCSAGAASVLQNPAVSSKDFTT